MKKSHVVWSRAKGAIVSVGIIVGSPSPAGAGELGHFVPALADVRDYVMPAEPGFAVKLYNYFYRTDTFKNADGQRVSSLTFPGGRTVDLDLDVNIYVLAPAFLWVSEWEPLGARYGVYIVPTFGNSSVGAALTTETGLGRSAGTSSFGVGDLFVQPVWLNWGYANWDVVVGYGFYAPIGKFDADSANNIGLGFWTHQFQGTLAWYPWKERGTAIIGTLTYEINQKVEDMDVTPGQRLSFNLGVSQFLPLNSKGLLLELGIVGYGQWQTTDDTGADVARPDVHDRLYGIGPQIGLTYAPWKAAATLKWAHELSARDRFQGDNFTLNLAVQF